MSSLALQVVVHEPMSLAIPLPDGWTVQFADDGNALAAVGGDDLGNDLLNPSITVERKAWSGEFAELSKLAEASLDEMRSSYADFNLLWSRERPDIDRVARAYSYTHPHLGPITQVQSLVNATRVVSVTCTAPRETYDQLAETFERIVLSIDEVDPDAVEIDDEADD